MQPSLLKRQYQNMEIQNDQIRIIVATDVHLGHKEQDPVRGNDSYEGLEEVFQNARKHEVDFLLLGGDLFDQVNPSKECYLRCLKIFNDNIFGRKEHTLEVSLNGQSFKANFALQNVNITLPVFTIHGNHDYPNNNFGKISVCDLLHQSNFVNYFGKQLSLHNFIIRPLIISKKNCNTKIALYGLGYIKDTFLNDLFQQKKAFFEKPIGSLGEYFTIFITHQNRYKKTSKTGVPLSQAFRPQNIPQWINLTIWCHQHEAIYKTQFENDRVVYQPGSTVITSLIETQSYKKQCVLIKINRQNFSIQPVLLNKSYRPMFCFNFQTKKMHEQFVSDEEFFTFVDQKIADTINQSKKITPHKLPIIRIKLQYLGSKEMFRSQQLQNKYQSQVANALKIFSFRRQKKVQKIQAPPNQFDDFETLQLIKNKKGHSILPSSTAHTFKNLLKQSLAEQPLHFFPHSFFQEFSSSISPEMSQAVSMFGKQVNEISAKIDRFKNKQIDEMDQKILTEYKRTLKLQYQQVQKGVKLGPQTVKKSQIVFPQTVKSQIVLPNQLNNQKQILTHQKFYERCKFLENLVIVNTSEMFNKQPHLFQKIKIESPQRQSKIQKEKDPFQMERDRSQSQDCCERACKQQINEQRNKLHFHNAQLQIQEANSRKRKRDDNIKPRANTKKDSKQANQHKKIKFSTDFK